MKHFKSMSPIVRGGILQSIYCSPSLWDAKLITGSTFAIAVVFLSEFVLLKGPFEKQGILTNTSVDSNKKRSKPKPTLTWAFQP